MGAGRAVGAAARPAPPAPPRAEASPPWGRYGRAQAPQGREAPADGVVEKASWFSSYGNFIELAHGGNMETRYGHLSGYNVVGDAPPPPGP